MTVRVLLFGPLTDIAGAGPHFLQLSATTTVQQVLDAVYEKWPALRAHDASLLVAVNLAYARRDEIIPPDAEVALMPPVQGG